MFDLPVFHRQHNENTVLLHRSLDVSFCSSDTRGQNRLSLFARVLETQGQKVPPVKVVTHR